MRPPKLTEHVLNSTLIRAYTYNEHELTLDVTFADGSEFKYEKVDPPTMSKVFDSPGSVGGKFRKLIAHRYKFTKTS